MKCTFPIRKNQPFCPFGGAPAGHFPHLRGIGMHPCSRGVPYHASGLHVSSQLGAILCPPGAHRCSKSTQSGPKIQNGTRNAIPGSLQGRSGGKQIALVAPEKPSVFMMVSSHYTNPGRNLCGPETLFGAQCVQGWVLWAPGRLSGCRREATEAPRGPSVSCDGTICVLSGCPLLRMGSLWDLICGPENHFRYAVTTQS